MAHVRAAEAVLELAHETNPVTRQEPPQRRLGLCPLNHTPLPCTRKPNSLKLCTLNPKPQALQWCGAFTIAPGICVVCAIGPDVCVVFSTARLTHVLPCSIRARRPSSVRVRLAHGHAYGSGILPWGHQRPRHHPHDQGRPGLRYQNGLYGLYSFFILLRLYCLYYCVCTVFTTASALSVLLLFR